MPTISSSTEKVQVTEVRRHFCDYVLNWKRTGKLELFIDPDPTQDVCVSALVIVEHLAQSDDPVPHDVAVALGLPVGSSYARAAVPVIAAWHAPIEQTPEEEAELEEFVLQASEIFEQFNEQNPNLPQFPVAYPKATRRRQ